MVETGTLEAVRRDALEQLIERAGFFALPSRMTSGYPDMIQFRIHIERSGEVHDVLLDDDQVSDALRALIDQVLEGAAPPRRERRSRRTKE